MIMSSDRRQAKQKAEPPAQAEILALRKEWLKRLASHVVQAEAVGKPCELTGY